jgi:coatomer subunit gamma
MLEKMLCKVVTVMIEPFCFTLQIEATEVFFAVTKLFQSKDVGLRRMVYLMIKELSPSADEVLCMMTYLLIFSNPIWLRFFWKD